MRTNKRKRKLTKKNIYSSLAALLLALCFLLLEHMGLINPASDVVPAADTAGNHQEAKEGKLTVHFLDVGQGSAAFVESDGHYMLIDGGDRAHSSFVVSYLKQLGVTSLDYILVSHYHADHLNGVIGALNAFETAFVICPGYETDTKLYQSFRNIIDEKNIPAVYPSIGDAFTLGSSYFTVIAPVNYDYSNENNNSIGIRLVNGGDSFLFTGDAEAESEEDFSSLPTELSCDVYAAGHHGSASSTTYSLLEKALPESVVISCGSDNSYGHPHEETIEKLEAIGARVFRTDRQGTLTAASSGHGITWNVQPDADYSED